MYARRNNTRLLPVLAFQPESEFKYRVSHLVANLGWVELNLGSSLVGSYCPGRMVEHPKSMSAKPSPRPDGTPCIVMLRYMRVQLLAPSSHPPYK